MRYRIVRRKFVEEEVIVDGHTIHNAGEALVKAQQHFAWQPTENHTDYSYELIPEPRQR